MTTIRVDDEYSSKYALMEDTFIKIGKGDGQGNMSEKIYKLEPMKKNLIENFLYARESMITLAKGNVTADGKATISDRATGRPIYIGEGLIPQVERFASKAVVNRVTINTFNTIIQTMAEKSENPTGNVYMFMINERMWGIVQNVLGNYLADRHTDGAYLWSNGGQGKFVKVGNTFDSYEWGKQYFCPCAA